jgi:hypothetical protein
MCELSKLIHCSTFPKHTTNYKNTVTVKSISLSANTVIHAHVKIKKSWLLLSFQYVNIQVVFGAVERKPLMQDDDFALI